MTSERLYFAYGSNMASEQMAARCRNARSVGVGRLDGHRFRINWAGVATVVPEVGGAVFGRLWSLDAADLGNLDRYEGVDGGAYRRSPCTVHSPEGQLDALMYVAVDAEIGRPRPDYMERVLAAAGQLRLPDTYIEELTSWT